MRAGGYGRGGRREQVGVWAACVRVGGSLGGQGLQGVRAWLLDCYCFVAVCLRLFSQCRERLNS